MSKDAIWMQTYTGRAWNLRDPRPDNVVLADIVTPLSRIPRFNGHTTTAVSVLAHSLSVAELVGYKAKPYALLHDAHEAYLGDITTPVAEAIKEWQLPSVGTPKPLSALDCLKHAHDAAIFEAFGLDWPSDRIRQEVREADEVVLSTERAFYMGTSDCPWGDLPDPLCRSALYTSEIGVDTQCDFAIAVRQWCPKVPE